MAKKRTSNRWRHPTRKFCYCFKRPDSEHVYTSIHGVRESTDLLWDPSNKKEALRILEQRIKQYHLPEDSHDQTINDLISQYANVHFPNYTKAQQNRYNKAIKHLLSKNHNLNYITEIRNDINENLTILSQKYSSPYIRTLLVCIRKIFDFGIEDNLIERNPVKKAMFPEGGRKPRQLFFSKKEMMKLIDYVRKNRDSEFADLIEFLSIFGTRISEALGGKVEDIDDENNQLMIRDFKRANKNLGENFTPRYYDISIFDTYSNASEVLKRIKNRHQDGFYFRWKHYARLEKWLMEDMKVLNMYVPKRSFHAIRKYAENQFILQGYPISFGSMFFGHTESVMRKHYLEVLGPKKFRELVQNTLKKLHNSPNSYPVKDTKKQ